MARTWFWLRGACTGHWPGHAECRAHVLPFCPGLVKPLYRGVALSRLKTKPFKSEGQVPTRGIARLL
jgi:hypothetical protein